MEKVVRERMGEAWKRVRLEKYGVECEVLFGVIGDKLQ